jgi:hypothetical protein
MVAMTLTALLAAPLTFAAEEAGVFETIRESSLSFAETTAPRSIELAIQGGKQAADGFISALIDFRPDHAMRQNRRLRRIST